MSEITSNKDTKREIYLRYSKLYQEITKEPPFANEEGVANLCIRVEVFDLDLMPYLLDYTAKKYLGEDYKEVTLSDGKYSGKNSFNDAYPFYMNKKFSEREAIDSMITLCPYGLSWGLISCEELEPHWGRYIIYNSYQADSFIANEGKSNEGVCNFFRGYIGEILELVRKTPYVVDEIKCKSKGDPYCEFIAREEDLPLEKIEYKEEYKSIEDAYKEVLRLQKKTIKSGLSSYIPPLKMGCIPEIGTFSNKEGNAIKAGKNWMVIGVVCFPHDWLAGTKDLCGLSEEYLVDVGDEYGRMKFDKFLKMGFDKDKSLQLVLAEAWYCGWGLINIKNEEKEAKVDFYNSFEVSSHYFHSDEEPDGGICFFTRGVVQGAYSSWISLPCSSEEIKCEAKGDEHCEFRIFTE